MRGTITGTKPGDKVEVWFEGGGQKSESFTYEMVSDSNRRMLVVAAEDYSGASPVQTPGPHYAQTYLDALAANGVHADVYDVDARGRTAPDALGVLSHYEGVIWYTGDDVVTREAGPRPAATPTGSRSTRCSRCAPTWTRAAASPTRASTAGMQFTGAGVGTQFYDPKDEAVCRIGGRRTRRCDPRRCLLLRGSTQGGDLINDVLQYWFGGMVQIAGDGQNGTTPYGLNGIGNPFDGLSWSLTAPQPAATSARRRS